MGFKYLDRIDQDRFDKSIDQLEEDKEEVSRSENEIINPFSGRDGKLDFTKIGKIGMIL